MTRYVILMFLVLGLVISCIYGFNRFLLRVEHYVVNEDLNSLSKIHDSIITNYGAACDLRDRPQDPDRLIKGSKYDPEVLCQIWSK